VSRLRPSDALSRQAWRLRPPLLFRLPRRTSPVSHVFFPSIDFAVFRPGDGSTSATYVVLVLVVLGVVVVVVVVVVVIRFAIC